MDMFENPKLDVKEIGTLKTPCSKDIASSPFSIGFETLDRQMFNPDTCYDLMSQAGAKWARCQTGWIRCETVKGAYDFAWLDEVVDQLLSRGITPWFNLGYGNPLYMEGIPHPTAVGCCPLLFGEDCTRAWLRYVDVLIRRYAGRVDRIEIWNEPNIEPFWFPGKPSGAEYARLVAATAPVIRAANPRAEILGCCAGVAVEFMLEALQAGMGPHIQGFCIHPYATVPEEHYANGVHTLRRLLDQHAPGARLYQGECGYPAQTYGHHDEWMQLYNTSEEIQAKYVIRRLTLDSMLDLDMRSYFHITDLMENVYRQANGQVRPPVKLGLTHGLTYQPKRSFHAFRCMAALLDADTRPAELCQRVGVPISQRQCGVMQRVATVTGQFVKKGFPMYTWYYPEDLQMEWKGTPDCTLSILKETERPIDEPVLIDPLSGRIFAVPFASDSPQSSTVPIMLTDYPLFLTDRKALDCQPS